MSARFRIDLATGARLEAVDVIVQPGWLEALVRRYRIEVRVAADGREAGVRVPAGIERRLIPAGQVVRIVDRESVAA